MLTHDVLKTAFPTMSRATREMVLTSIRPALDKYEINTAKRLAMFLGQCAHESAMFTAKRENLNYSADALQRVFKKYFPTRALALAYARKPAAIANRVYASRLGNGNEKSGDGWKARGVGHIQLSGRANITAFGKSHDMTFEQAIAYLETSEGGFMGAGWFWSVNKLNPLCDRWEGDSDIIAVSRKINGGDIGKDDRIAKCNAVFRALNPATA